MNRAQSRYKPIQNVTYRVAQMKSQTPYIVWLERRGEWRVDIPLIEGMPKAETRHFSARAYGSKGRALMAATEYRDASISQELRDAMYKMLDTKATEVVAPNAKETGGRYKPRLHSQWQLWHTPRKQQADTP